MTDQIKPAALTIQQGAPVVNGAIVYKESDNVVAIEVDLHSKYCELFGTHGGDGGPGITIGATDESLYLAEGVDRDIFTDISFCDYGPEWSVWAASCARYAACVCLIREDK